MATWRAHGGIATGYAVGCCLRCVFCWVSWSRDFPEKYGSFHSPERAARRIEAAARKYGVRKARISGCEPTLCPEHLLELLKHVEKSSAIRLFILETNGILMGADRSLAEEVAAFSKVHVRVSLKAGTPEDFTRKTGAIPEAFELPFKAIRNLMEAGASFHVAAMSADPRLMSPEERLELYRRLAGISPELPKVLEEEVCDPYDTALARLKLAGFKIEWPLKQVYPPISKIVG
ncbi:MAG: molybdenum cofactor biosynthesis protein MoaA [Thermoproteota archaeon]|nr:MAG: molybdenum cofactor biosynthesis protein MoaA [Candidatus Korarchaeota archaeon]